MASDKTNVLLNLIKHQRPDIEKVYLYAKDPLAWKYQLPINGGAKVGITTLTIQKVFTAYSQWL